MVLGLGSWEIVLVGLALLVLFGPEHAPGAIRKAGEMQARVEQALRQLESAVDEDRSDDEKIKIPTSREELPKSDEQDGSD